MHTLISPLKINKSKNTGIKHIYMYTRRAVFLNDKSVHMEKGNDIFSNTEEFYAFLKKLFFYTNVVNKWQKQNITLNC